MKPKLLVLTPRYPYPVIGGDRLRIYELCKQLSSKYELTLLSLCESSEELEMALPDDDVFIRIERVYLSKWRSYVNCLLALPTRKPLQVAYYSSASFRNRFKELVSEQDMVLCHLIRVADYALDCGKPVLIEFTDAISLNYERVKKVAKSGWRNRIYSLEQNRLNIYEKYVGSKSALNLFVSQIDADYLFPSKGLIAEKTLVCSNGVDVSVYPFLLERESKELVFIGNMQSVQNMDAATWFAKNVMPLLYSDGYTFNVVGRISEANKKYLNRYPGVLATGAVDSIVDTVKKSVIGVCPMRIGAGVQNKVLEYMALGLPCIVSSLGHEGLEAVHQQDLFVIDDPREYADKIKELVSNKAIRKYVAENARRYVEEHHSWEAKLSPLIDRLDSLC